MRYNGYMKLLAHRELRNHSGRVLREAEAGERFVVTVDGRPVATLGPPEGPRFIRKSEYLAILRQHQPDPHFFSDIADLEGERDTLEDPWER